MRDLIGRPAVPEIRQSEAAECGLACLAMVLGYHGHATDLGTLRRRYPTSLSGMTMHSLMALASRMALSTRALRLEPEQLGQLKLPAILHWDMNHFVVLERVTRDGVIIMDPAVGRISVKWSKVNTSFTGVALELKPTEGWQKRARPPRKVSVLDFLRPFAAWRTEVTLIVSLSVLLEVFTSKGIGTMVFPEEKAS